MFSVQRAVEVLGDGNCAFNAFALGVCDLVLAGKFEEHLKLYEYLKKHLDLRDAATPPTFKEWLERNPNHEYRQQCIQGILRKIAVKFIKRYYDAVYKSVYEEQLWNAYQTKAFNIEEDTFIVHEHIKRKFEEKDLTKEELLRWWGLPNQSEPPTASNIYFDNILQSARFSGDRERWGGEPEIDALAVCFHINIRWKKGVNDDTGRVVGFGGGIINGLKIDELKMLQNLGIGEPLGSCIRLNRFDSVVDLEEAINPLEDDRGELLACVEALVGNDTAIPEYIENNAILKEKLRKKGILNENNLFISDGDSVARERIKQKILGITDNELKQKILPKFKSTPVAFSMRINEEHWTYDSSDLIHVSQQDTSQNTVATDVQFSRRRDKNSGKNKVSKIDKIFEILESDIEIRTFIKAFHSRLANENRKRDVSTARSEDEERADAMGRLLVGDEIVSAFAIDEHNVLISTNRDNHCADKVSIKLESLAIQEALNFQKIKIILNFEITSTKNFHRREHIETEYSPSLDRKEMCSKISEITFKIGPRDHKIKEYPYEIEFIVPLPNLPIELFSGFSVMSPIGIEVPFERLPFKFSLDPFQRRAGALFHHLGLIAAYNLIGAISLQNKFMDVIEKNRKRVLIQTLGWEAPTWFKLDKVLRKYSFDDLSKKEKAVYESKKEQLKELRQFIEKITDELLKFLAANDSARNIHKTIHAWVKNKLRNIDVKTLPVCIDNPKLFFERSSRYFIDLMRWETFIEREVKSRTKLASVLASVGLIEYSKKTEQDLVQSFSFFIKGARLIIVDEIIDFSHAEIRLYKYLIRDKNLKSDKPPYFGISQLCCPNCHVFLKSNGIDYIGNNKFRAGIHTKHYANWPLDSSLRNIETLRKFFGETYSLYERLNGDLSYDDHTRSRQEWAIWVLEDLGSLMDEQLDKLGFSNKKIWSFESNLDDEVDDSEAIKKIIGVLNIKYSKLATTTVLPSENSNNFFLPSAGHKLNEEDKFHGFKEYLLKTFSLEVLPTSKEGSCQFRSVTKQLKILAPLEYERLVNRENNAFFFWSSADPSEDAVQQILRIQAVDYLAQNSSTMALKLIDKDIEDYLENMSMPEKCGDDITLYALANVLNHSIIVLYPGSQSELCDYTIYNPNNINDINVEDSIILLFDGESHYETFRNRPNNDFNFFITNKTGIRCQKFDSFA